MADPHIQYSFHAGEWAPALNARVDQAKYHSAAALLRNFFVDYRGGASTCPGTKYVLKCQTPGARLIPFQAALTVGYILEFGDNYIRFYFNGQPVVENGFAITAASAGSVTIPGNNYAVGDWLFIGGKYYIATSVSGSTVALADLNGVAIDSTGFTGASQRVYTLQSPYDITDVFQIKYAQNVSYMVLCHPNYRVQVLTLISATHWTIAEAVFGSTANPPTGLSATSTIAGGGGPWHYAYQVTSVDDKGQESAPSVPVTLGPLADIRRNEGSNTITWAAVPGAQFYNVYEAELSDGAPVPVDSSYGFIGFTHDTSFVDSNIQPDFAVTPPIVKNPFIGGGVTSVAVTAPGAYTTVPAVTFSAPTGGAGSQTATGAATLQVTAFGTFNDINGQHAVGVGVRFNHGVVLIPATVFSGFVTSFQPLTYPGSSRGSISGTGTGAPATLVSGNGGILSGVVWGVASVGVFSPGTGYTTPPTVTFSGSGGASAVASIDAGSGNPSVPTFFQQRLVLAAPSSGPSTFHMSQPGSPFNFNITYPVQDDNAITEALVSDDLNFITNMVTMPRGLLMFTSNNIWQVNGGGSGSSAAVTVTNITADAQSHIGSSDVKPIVANYNVLYVQSKGSIFRDLTYNFYTNIFTGADISILSSHLFYGYEIIQSAWAEEPFKIVWAVRNDGVLLSLTYLKEHELIGWAHRDTLGLFSSVAKVVEATPTAGNVDAVYVVVHRFLSGTLDASYVERMAERSFPYGVEDAWTVDSGLRSVGQTPAAGIAFSQAGLGTGVLVQCAPGFFTPSMVGWVIRVDGGIATITNYIGPTQVLVTVTQPLTAILTDDAGAPLPQPPGAWTLWQPFTVFGGLDHLNGFSVVGLADGVPVGPLTVVNGSVTLPKPATKVTLGLAFVPQLQTLALDIGEPTIQGKRKQIPAVTARLKDSLGLMIGRSFDTLVPMKDTVVGNIGTMTNQRVTNLVTGDARTIVDPLWDVPGQYCFQVTLPYPVSILGVIPEITVGDTKK